MSEQIMDVNELMQVRIEKLAELKNKGINPFGSKFETTHQIQEVIDRAQELIESQEEVVVAGRLMAKRGHGKAGFANLQDVSGQVQIYSRVNDVGEEIHDLFKKADIGDILGVSGTVLLPIRVN